MSTLGQLNQTVVKCNLCTRLRKWSMSRQGKRKQYRNTVYWAKPVPGFGDEQARILIVGLAPGAHGANRTGRPFTGDDAGDLLYAGLFKAGFSSKPRSISSNDGLILNDVYITNVVRCVPPKDKPDASEFSACAPFLHNEISFLKKVQVIIALGEKAFDELKKKYRVNNRSTWGPFKHGKVVSTPDGAIKIVCCYHTSRRNVNNPKVKIDLDKLGEMLDKAKSLLLI